MCSPTSSGPRSADRKSTRLNSSHSQISYAVFCLKKKIDGWRGNGTAGGTDSTRRTDPAAIARSGGIAGEPGQRLAGAVPDRELPSGRNVRERVRQIICAFVCAAGPNPDGPAGSRVAQGCSAALSACACGTRRAKREVVAAWEGIGIRRVRGNGQGNLEEHTAFLTQRWRAASDHCEQPRVPGGPSNLAARRAGAPDAP